MKLTSMETGLRTTLKSLGAVNSTSPGNPALQTDPLNPDTDGDWASDREELFGAHTDPRSDASAPLTLYYLSTGVGWSVSSLPADPSVPWELPYPVWFDGGYYATDANGNTARAGGPGDLCTWRSHP